MAQTAKRIIFTLWCFIITLALWAQVTLRGAGPSEVAVGQRFQVQYTTSSSDVESIQAPAWGAGIRELYGPAQSTQSSYTWVNGKMSGSSSTTYTYTLVAVKEGTYTIPAASIRVDGKVAKSNTLSIKILPGNAQQPQGGGQQQPQTSRRGSMGSTGQLTDKNLFMTVTANKKKVYEQEAVLLTYKVFTDVDLVALDNKMPDLKGAHVQEVQLPQNKSAHLENVGGRNYQTVVWRQYVVFPQKSGKLVVPALKFDGVVRLQYRSNDPIEDFFNGGMIREVNRTITAPSVSIDVQALPQAPQGFSGAVGTFDLKSEIDKTSLKANEVVSVKLTLSGTGNLKLVKTPTLAFPKDFETYSPKTSEKSSLTTAGVSGHKTFEYLAIPRHAGQFHIPAGQFIYFDTNTHQYKTLTTQSFDLTVAKGKGGQSTAVVSGQEDLKLLGSDIHYIKQGDAHVVLPGDSLLTSTRYWLYYLVALGVFLGALIVFRKQMREAADLTKMRGKKAGKVATKRLKQASVLLKKGDEAAFYDEVMRTLWGYLADKLNLSAADLNKDNVRSLLQERGISQDETDAFLTAVSDCEFARFAPGDKSENMDRIYQSAEKAILSMQDALDATRKNTTGKGAALTILLLLLTTLPLEAATKQQADAAYAAEKFQTAARGYETLLKEGHSAELYYNLGCCYYRMDEMPRAVLNFERALRLSPGDEDIRFNLAMARSKTIDKIVPVSEMFFVSWWKSLTNMQSSDGWAQTALTLFILMLLAAAIFFFTTRVALKKAGFFTALTLLLLCILSNTFAYIQHGASESHTGAIIMTSAVTVKSTPSETGTDLFILHEGTRVDILDDSMKAWKLVRLADGKQGWMPTADLEKI